MAPSQMPLRALLPLCCEYDGRSEEDERRCGRQADAAFASRITHRCVVRSCSSPAVVLHGDPACSISSVHCPDERWTTHPTKAACRSRSRGPAAHRLQVDMPKATSDEWGKEWEGAHLLGRARAANGGGDEKCGGEWMRDEEVGE
jgi:hypothetical protein